MSLAEQARALSAYNWWANQKLLDAASRLSAEELDRDTGATFGSIGANLRHIVAAEMGWHSVLAGIQLQRPEGLRSPAPMSDIREWYEDSRGRLDSYAAAITDDSIVADVHAERGGQTYAWPAWQVLTHVVNHGTQHRAETGGALAALGHSPGDLDFIYFVAGGQ